MCVLKKYICIFVLIGFEFYILFFSFLNVFEVKGVFLNKYFVLSV